MASYSDKVSWWADWRCNTSKMVGVEFPGWPTPLLVADASAPAWELFASLMRKHGYFFRESAGGTYNCRRISGSTSWSLHAYGIALDLNPSKNPYGTEQYDFPRAFINDVLATGLFKWGIQFNDPMHWEIDVPPGQIQLPEEDPVSLPVNAQSGKEEIRHVQEMLGVPATGDWDFPSALDDLRARSGSGDPRDHVNGRMYTHLLGEFIAAKAPQGASTSHDHDGRYVRDVNVSR